MVAIAAINACSSVQDNMTFQSPAGATTYAKGVSTNTKQWLIIRNEAMPQSILKPTLARSLKRLKRGVGAVGV